MRTASTLVGAPRAPDIDAQQRGRRRLSSSTNTPANHDHVPRTVTPTQTLLDRRRPAALPQNRSHLTHGTCRSAPLTLGRSLSIGEEEGWSAWSSGRRSGGCVGSMGCRVERSVGGPGCTGIRSRGCWASAPPRYERRPAGSKLDSFKEWVCEQLVSDPRMPSQRLREMATELGYEGGKSIFDE